MSGTKSLLLIGASRGLGLALAEEYLKRGWHVVATERDKKSSQLGELMTKGTGQLQIETVDINEPQQVAALHEKLVGQKFDMLFVNAGVTNAVHETPGDVSTDEFIRVMTTNALSPMRVIETMLDLLTPTATIGLMSSGLGSVSNNTAGGYEIYRGSKAALNTFMRSFAARHSNDKRAMVLIAPGWVRTDMGGSQAPLSVEDSIPNVANTLDSQAGKPGLQYLDYMGRTVPW